MVRDHIFIVGNEVCCGYCGELFNTQRAAIAHIDSEHDLQCVYCGFTGKRIEVIKHQWAKHRTSEINKTLCRMDNFIINSSKGFLLRYRIIADLDDVLQFVRISINKVLQERYDPHKVDHPIIGDPSADRFAKSCCAIFFKRFLQQYYFKRNLVNINITSIDETEPNPPVISLMNDIPHDYQIIIEEVKRSLNKEELEIFNYMIDESEIFTQAKIADVLGVSQPMVSYKVKSIRDKTIKIINKIYK